MDKQTCELCGMVAVARIKDAHGVTHHYCEHHVPRSTKKVEHDTHAGHSVNMFRDRFWISLVLTLVVMAIAPFWQDLLGYQIEWTRTSWLSAVLGSVVFWYGGLVFLKSAGNELRAKQPGMMTLIALAITSSYLYSLAITFQLLVGMDFFWEVTSLITIMLLGHWFEMRAVSGAQDALGELAKLLPDMADRLIKGKPKAVKVADLKMGDLVLVRPGAKVPADGVVIEGESSVSESMLTGESRPIDKAVGAKVIAGTVNGAGSLTIKVEHIGEDTALAGIMRLVSEAQRSKSTTQILADRAAFYLTIIAVVVGMAALIGWLLSGAGWNIAIERMVSVLIITCPHALGLAVPLVTSISTSMAAKQGVLIRNRMALEAVRSVDTVLFDKTGTLTVGKPGVTDVVPGPGWTKLKLLTVAAALEGRSEHVLARAIVARANSDQAIFSGRITDWRSLPGQGVVALVDDEQFLIGGPNLLAQHPHKIRNNLATRADELSRMGKSVIYVLRRDEVIGILAAADEVRPESKVAIESLRAMNIESAIVTGDASDVAGAVARELNIAQVFAEVLPADKTTKGRLLQEQGHRIAMVGDGVNDAPSLTQADVGIAIGAGTDVAIESAGIVLVNSDPRSVARVIGLSRATYRKMIQNLIWATGYNVVAIPLAAGALAPWGLTLAPAVSAVLMSFSTIIVAANAQLLRRSALAKM